jgi:hypothetical protein
VSRLLHLLYHDVRQHWRMLLAWTLLIAVQPFASVLFRGDPGKPAAIDGVIPALLVIGARLLVGAVLVMTLVQQDAPLDDRTFWRTRPIPPATMAVAKLLLVALVLLGWPLLVTLGVALVAQVPLWYWPAIAFQVLVIDGTIIGVALVSAALTRHLSTGLVVAILTVLLALAVYSFALRTGVRYEEPVPGKTLLADPKYALPTVLLVLVLGLWTMACAVWWGVRGRQRAVVLGAAAAAAVLVVWYVPAARLHRRPVTPVPSTPVVRLARHHVRAFVLPIRPERIAVVTDVAIEGVPAESLRDLWLLDGTVATEGDRRAARAPQDPNVGHSPGAPMAALLAVMSPEDFATWRGRSVQFHGRYRTSIVTATRLAEGPLTQTTRLVTPLGGLQVSALPTDTSAVAAGHLTVLRRLPEGGHWLDVFLRDAETGHRVGPLFLWSTRTSLSYLLQLPTLARPFEWDRIELGATSGPSGRWGHRRRDTARMVADKRARVEMYEMEPPVREDADAELTFVMPSEAAPAAR